MKAVHFGAGNIGRGFIGFLLRESGYDVTFVDVNDKRVILLNELGRYPVQIVSKNGMEMRWVEGINALNAKDFEAVAQALAEADIITTAVGKSALIHVAPLILEGLRRRRHGIVPVMVVACENVLGNSIYLENLVRTVGGDAATFILQSAVFPDCVVDRIVPNTPSNERAHPLTVTVEDYAQWAIDASHLKNVPLIHGVEFRQGLETVLAQKLFTLNMAHAIVGYYGYLHGSTYIHEAMVKASIRELLDGALSEVSRVLIDEYNIAPDAQSAYAAKVIHRLENPALCDTVVRVAREPRRKLGAQDRLIAPALSAAKLGHVPIYLATGIAAALAFDAPEDHEAQELHTLIGTVGVKEALRRVSGVEEHHVLTELVNASAIYRKL